MGEDSETLFVEEPPELVIVDEEISLLEPPEDVPENRSFSPQVFVSKIAFSFAKLRFFTQKF